MHSQRYRDENDSGIDTREKEREKVKVILKQQPIETQNVKMILKRQEIEKEKEKVILKQQEKKKAKIES